MYIVSISVDKRHNTIPEVQSVLTEYGDKILTRLGIHDEKNENRGIVIISYEGENIEEFVERLNQIEHANINYMEA